MFDNGLRKVPVGDMQADGKLKNIKYGLVDKNGKFTAEPVYDEIKAYYISDVNENGLIKARHLNMESLPLLL